MSLLEVRDLEISFRSSNKPVKVVSSLDFTIEEAQVFGLVGESGCGKSLTAHAVMGILPHNAYAEGKIIFQGNNLLSLDRESMRRLRGKEISMIFQEPMTSLNPVLTIGYQIAEVLTTHMGVTNKEAFSQTVELLRAVKIPSPEIRIREYPHQMSGGMRQRVMIAMAIACNPSLLIADEPTTALDVTIQAQILELLRTLREQRKMAMLLITHDIGVIAENADAGRDYVCRQDCGTFKRPGPARRPEASLCDRASGVSSEKEGSCIETNPGHRTQTGQTPSGMQVF